MLLRRFLNSFSVMGLLVGLLFLIVSLTPSLLPRIPFVQGVLAGLAFAVGYGVGRAGHTLWTFLEFKELTGRAGRITAWVCTIVLLVLAVIAFNRNALWQNSIRERMEMAPVESAYPWTVAAVAILVALFVLLLSRVIQYLMYRASDAFNRILPRRVSLVLGISIGLIAFVLLVNGLVIQRGLHAIDAAFARLDLLVEDGLDPPDHEFASGGPNSIVEWEDIGVQGKTFLTNGPGREAIAEFSGRDALEPIRVYAGFNSADDFEERAQLALQDLVAMGGFDRSALIVATPTGTGWLDPAAVQPVAYLYNGDLAIVSMQYSYVPSWVSLIVDPDRSRLAARALFDAVFQYWTELPKDSRPQLYLFGLSLGALGSEASADLVSLFTDPIDGALWSGPPFASTIWPRVTQGRNEGSPARLPEYRDGELIRFMNQEGVADPPNAEWGPMRLLYLQYASDPMVFFSPSLAWNKPDWLGEDRGADISPYFDWYPLVTFLQVGFDIPMATSTPAGFGHSYHALDYIEGWIEIMQPEGWTEQDTARLNEKFKEFDASPL